MTAWRGFRRRGAQKFGNVPTRIDGRLFHSKLEAARYQELKAMEAAGLIRELECQPRYHLEVGGTRICDYIADFRYVDAETGSNVVEDAKGFRTADYKLKARLMLACHGIEVQEITKVRGRR